jgi:hypothetical protein
MNVKFADAKQARDIYGYKNLKRKLLKTMAAIWFNKMCRQKHLTPSYISITRMPHIADLLMMD